MDNVPSCSQHKPNDEIKIGFVAVAEDHLSSVFSALADPTRRAMLRRLAAGEATVRDLAAPSP